MSLGILKSVSPRVQKLSDLNRLPGDMSEHSRPYVIHSDDECERLELQARLAKIEQHLRYLPVSPRDRVLDAGCGSGAGQGYPGNAPGAGGAAPGGPLLC